MNVNAYVGAPFQANGRGPAYDCWGLVWAVYHDLMGIDVPSYDNQYFGVKDKNLPRLIEKEAKKWNRIDNEQPGDIVLIKIAGRLRHVGVVVEPKKKLMLHALAGCNVCLEPYTAMRWRNRIDGFLRYNPS